MVPLFLAAGVSRTATIAIVPTFFGLGEHPSTGLTFSHLTCFSTPASSNRGATGTKDGRRKGLAHPFPDRWVARARANGSRKRSTFLWYPTTAAFQMLYTTLFGSWSAYWLMRSGTSWTSKEGQRYANNQPLIRTLHTQEASIQ